MGTLYPILASCPKLILLKFKMAEYPKVTMFQQLASTLTQMHRLFQNVSCNDDYQYCPHDERAS